MTDRDRFRRVREVFDEAIERSGSERERYLAESCGDDRALRSEVEELLKADTKTLYEGAVIDEGVSSDLMRSVVESSLAGKRLGEFEVLEVLGTGGMGTVYKAVQASPRRVVALKTMRLGLAADSARRRFEYEAEVLGRLRHPGIAQVYAAGTFHGSGGQEVPYFAMEYVEDARPLHVFLEEENLGVEPSLHVFLQVCDAVSAGHQRGVIHRDLKPENLLVDGGGRVKVIDFGIARAVDADGGGQTRQTGAGQVLGTLEFMSPEQLGIGGGEVDTRSDVYSLGVILYEILAGRTPFAVGGKPLSEVVDLVQQEAKSPSAVGKRSRVTPQELDWITLKAIEKDPARRYPSVSELAADVQRYLDDEPVAAGPPSAMYRIAVFTRRHRTAVAAAVLVVLALVAGTVLATVGLMRAVDAENEARGHLDEAREELAIRRDVGDFLSEMFSAVHPARDGGKVPVADVLDDAASRVDELYAKRPAESVAIQRTIGASYLALGLKARARPLLERAVAIGRAELGEEDPETLLAMDRLGACIAQLGDLDEGMAVLRRAREIRLRTLGPDHRDTATGEVLLGELLVEKGEFAAAEAMLRHADEVLVAELGADHQYAIEAKNYLARMLEYRGQYDEALVFAREAVEQSSKRLSPTHHVRLKAMQGEARILRLQGGFRDALRIWQRVLESERNSLGETHSTTLATLNNMATALASIGKLEQAEERFRQVLRVYRANGEENSPNELRSSNNLAIVLQNQGKTTEALELLEDVMARATLELGEDDFTVAGFRVAYAASLRAAARYAEAEKALLRSEKIFEAKDPSSRMALRAYRGLEALYQAWGKPDLAARYRARVETAGK